MRTARSLVVTAVLIAAGCRSGDSVSLIPPDMQIRQLPGQFTPNRHTGPLTVTAEVDILNRSEETIILRRITVTPISSGGYTFTPMQRVITRKIEPGQIVTVDLQLNTALAPGMSPDTSLPATVRLTAVFDSDAGSFRRVITTPLGVGSRRPPGD